MAKAVHPMFVLAVIPFVALVCTGHLAMNACVLRSSAGSWCVQWSSVQRCDCAVSPCRSEPYKGILRFIAKPSSPKPL